MKLREVIVVRHANFGESEATGISQSEALAERLGPLMDSDSVVVLTSTAKRAWLTAKPICRRFGIRHFIESDILYWIEDEDRKKAPLSLKLIKEHGEQTEILVIITHFDYLKWLPAQIAQEFLGTQFSGGEQGYAHGWAFSLETKGIKPI